ncbi:MAG: peptide chain release factor N(5)-glutamine methyltransferase [Anaerolineae bacterium]|nr:peptide chain release factor N(5)-glutamine methyltransferase [Anaerolineae bacterium]MCX8067690.1 peptide chain release factor N(5)-glutamine methyltransferase [Anaerolineae bacterium]MDW7992783.1 peptide chain release factor N(5)-glutamine methyltransferase [Anaerolineae bacterium]
MTWTVAQALRVGTDRLRAVTETPRLEAEILLAHVTGLGRTVLLAHPERALGPEERKEYERLLACRATGYPLPYLTGRVEFYGLEFRVTPDVLIPRPETEVLVDRALTFRPHTVIDVGTGSGCIAIALAVHLPEARFWATDLSFAALRVAQENAHRHAVANRICFLQADLLSPLTGPVDLVVSNPPYVAEEEWISLPVSVRHEPALALKGGENGLGVIWRLLAEAPRLLRSGGTLLVEIGATQGERVRALAQDLIPGARISLLPDLAGHDRVLEVVL